MALILRDLLSFNLRNRLQVSAEPSQDGVALQGNFVISVVANVLCRMLKEPVSRDRKCVLVSINLFAVATAGATEIAVRLSEPGSPSGIEEHAGMAVLRRGIEAGVTGKGFSKKYLTSYFLCRRGEPMCSPFYAGQTRRSAPTIPHLKTGILFFVNFLTSNKKILLYQKKESLTAKQHCRPAVKTHAQDRVQGHSNRR